MVSVQGVKAMNAEIYFPREGKSFAQTSEKSFENTIKKLNEIDVNIIYKTEINLNSTSLNDALKVTDSEDEKISLVIIADGIKEDNPDKAKELFESIGIIEKVRHIEPMLQAENENTDKDNVQKEAVDKKADKQAKKEAKQLEKLRKRQEKELAKLSKSNKKSSSNDEQNNIENITGNGDNTQKKLFAYSAEHNGKLIILLPEAELLDTDFNTLLYSAVYGVINPKKKTSLWKRFLPCSGDRPVDVVRKIVLMLAICTFVVSSYMLVDILVVEPAISDNTNNGIKDLMVSTTEDENSNSKENSGSDTSNKNTVLADFKNLLEVNPDTIGWITIPDTKVDYVVVQPSEDNDPEYYLYRDFYGNYSKYGTIFMDYRSTLDSKNLILHGHHMQDGRMFAEIRKYADLEFYKTNPTFTFNTIYEKSQWKVISVFKTNTLEEHGEFFNYLRGDFATDYDFINFIYELRERSIIDCPVDVNENDTLVTLSTCAYDFDEFRFVVVARKVRDGESEDVDISKSDYNPNPLYPDIWYKTYGGTAPNVTNFQEAYNNGEIDWYDGEKTDWSEEDEDLTARELKEAKTKSIKSLTEYVAENSYAEEQQEEIDHLVEVYTEQINKAEDISTVEGIYDEAIDAIREIKTAEQLASEQSEREASEHMVQEITNARSAAIAEIKNSIAGNTYRSAQKTEVNSIIDNYSNKINKSQSLDDIESYKKQAINALSEIKTDDELTNEERQNEINAQAEKLANAKTSAINELNSYLSLDNYYSEQQSEIDSIISSYTSSINDSDSVDSVNNLLKKAKSELDKVKTSSAIDAEAPSSDPSSSEPEQSSETPSEPSADDQESSYAEETASSEETQ